MVLEITRFRDDQDGDIPVLKESQRRRFHSEEIIDEITNADRAWRQARFRADALLKAKNLVSKAYGLLMRQKASDTGSAELPSEFDTDLTKLTADSLQTLSLPQLKSVRATIDQSLIDTKTETETQDKLRMSLLRSVGNIVHDSVPIDQDEDNNEIYHTFGETPEKKYSHRDLIEMIDGVDIPAGTIAAGNRGYYLKGPCVLLEFAVLQLAMTMLVGKGYSPIIPPFFMNKNIMAEVAQLNQFDDELYKVTAKASEKEDDKEIDEKYLIATSEQPLCALHRDSYIEPETLPIRYAGFSTCFRQEVGSHGRDTAGIFRVHQFDKIEQFVLTSPEDTESWEEMERMITNAEEFYQALGISYRTVNMVSGELNLAAAKKYDLEGWFPGSKAFRELVSCSNCLDYQSRRLKIRYGKQKLAKDVKKGPQPYVHMLNSTMAAMTRVICIILETHQTEEGIKIPDALKPWMPEKFHLIPFVKPCPAPVVIKKNKAKK
ncbi:seryl-tRNA synthetase, cytoplasmic, partial [Sphaeroforma arctica JP610]